jgi:hypothetical protein
MQHHLVIMIVKYYAAQENTVTLVRQEIPFRPYEYRKSLIKNGSRSLRNVNTPPKTKLAPWNIFMVQKITFSETFKNLTEFYWIRKPFITYRKPDVSILSQIKPFHTISYYFFRIILASISRS